MRRRRCLKYNLCHRFASDDFPALLLYDVFSFAVGMLSIRVVGLSNDTLVSFLSCVALWGGFRPALRRASSVQSIDQQTPHPILSGVASVLWFLLTCFVFTSMCTLRSDPGTWIMLALLTIFILWNVFGLVSRRFSTPRPVHYRMKHSSLCRCIAILCLVLAGALFINAFTFNFGAYASIAKGRLYNGLVLQNGCAIVEIAPDDDFTIQRVLNTSIGILGTPNRNWPNSFWLLAEVPLLPFAIPLAWLGLRMRLQLKPATLCPTCSYDLRAHLVSRLPTQNSGLSTQDFSLPPRCPECGTPIPNLPQPHA